MPLQLLDHQLLALRLHLQNTDLALVPVDHTSHLGQAVVNTLAEDAQPLLHSSEACHLNTRGWGIRGARLCDLAF